MSLRKAVFGMQCFWGESTFAKITGVLNTRVGYAGGKSKNPTYESIGDHTAHKASKFVEVTEIEFDEQIVSYSDLLQSFFDHHDPTVAHKTQYRSLILYSDEDQKEKALKALEDVKKRKPGVKTIIDKLEIFYQAENYHQKYWLRTSNRGILKELKLNDEQIAHSTLATKINAFLAGYDNFDVLRSLAAEHSLSTDLVAKVESIAKAGGDPRACH